MKFSFVILLFFTFLGCSVSPFKEPSDSLKKPILKSVYNEDYDYVVLKVKEVLKNRSEDNECKEIDEETTYFEPKNMKVFIKKTPQNEVEVSIKPNILRDKTAAEDLMKEITKKIDSVEYDNNGNPVN